MLAVEPPLSPTPRPVARPWILTLDMHGHPHRWVSWQAACTYHARNMVAWSIGAQAFHILGGTCRIFAAGETRLVRNVDDRVGASGLIGLIGAGVVEIAAVVEGDATGFHLHRDRVGDIVAALLHL